MDVKTLILNARELRRVGVAGVKLSEAGEVLEAAFHAFGTVDGDHPQPERNAVPTRDDVANGTAPVSDEEKARRAEAERDLYGAS